MIVAGSSVGDEEGAEGRHGVVGGPRALKIPGGGGGRHAPLYQQPASFSRSKSLLGKGPARRRLEILFERKSLPLVRKSDIGLCVPRSILRRVEHFTRVVLSQPSVEVACDPDIVCSGNSLLRRM
jgi:hypothetical protein